MTLNPYEELNLPKTATTAEVKAAYRKRAKKAHPDAGGSSDASNRLSRAMLILSDPVRRQKYDQTGDIDEQTPDNAVAVAVALSIVVGFIAQVVSQHVSQNAPDPCGVDLVDVARKHFTKQRLEFANQKLPIIRMAKKMEQVEKRFRKRRKANPLLLIALQNQRIGTQEPLRQLDAKIQQLDDALLLLDGYDFDPDKTVVQPAQTMLGTNAFWNLTR